MRNVRVPFGIKNGRMVDIGEVERGLSCGCYCPTCNSPLIARKGDIRDHHFAHSAPTQCESALETAIHLMGKQVIEEAGTITLPEFRVTESALDQQGVLHTEKHVVLAGDKFDLAEILVEKNQGDTRPDITAMTGDQLLAIEIRVTNRVGPEKSERLRKQRIAAVEVDLSGLDCTVTKAEIYAIVVAGIEKKKWLTHPDEIEVRKLMRARLENRVRESDQDYNAKRAAQHSTHRRAALRSDAKRARARTRQFLPPDPSGRRWLLCDSCKHLWHVDGVSQDSVESCTLCPKCLCAVSLAPPMQGYQ